MSCITYFHLDWRREGLPGDPPSLILYRAFSYLAIDQGRWNRNTAVISVMVSFLQETGGRSATRFSLQRLQNLQSILLLNPVPEEALAQWFEDVVDWIPKRDRPQTWHSS